VPKQYCSLDGGPTLLELALSRAERLVPYERIVCVVAAAHRRWWMRDLVPLPETNVIVQPCNRGTSVGLLLPLLEILRRDPRATVVILPSDHFVADEAVLETAARGALTDLRDHPDAVILLGVEPGVFDADYGWIVPGRPLAEGLSQVARFVEKPDPAEAHRLIDLGGLWNSLVVVARARRLLALYEELNPALLWWIRLAQADEYAAPSWSLEAVYPLIPPSDLSRDILEKASDALLVERVPPCGWNDVGTPARLARCLRATESVPACRLRAVDERPVLGDAVAHPSSRSREITPRAGRAAASSGGR
jgi:mannose-1-phosphate guanylyltransferase